MRNQKPAGNFKADRTSTNFAVSALLVAVLTLLGGSGVTASAARADTVPISASVVQVNQDKGDAGLGNGTSIAARTCTSSSPPFRT